MNVVDLACCGADRIAGRTDRGQVGGGDDAGRHGVLEVVADVGDAVGPGHDLALGRGRGGPGPRVVADAVERLGAQVQRGQHDVGAPHGVVEARRRRKGASASSLAWPPGPCPQSWPRAMASVRATLRLQRRRPAIDGDLGHLDGVGEPGALVVGAGTRRPGTCRPAAGRLWRAGCGRGRARSRCAAGREPRPRAPAGPTVGRGWPRSPARRRSAASRPPRSSGDVGPSAARPECGGRPRRRSKGWAAMVPPQRRVWPDRRPRIVAEVIGVRERIGTPSMLRRGCDSRSAGASRHSDVRSTQIRACATQTTTERG